MTTTKEQRLSLAVKTLAEKFDIPLDSDEEFTFTIQGDAFTLPVSNKPFNWLVDWGDYRIQEVSSDDDPIKWEHIYYSPPTEEQIEQRIEDERDMLEHEIERMQSDMNRLKADKQRLDAEEQEQPGLEEAISATETELVRLQNNKEAVAEQRVAEQMDYEERRFSNQEHTVTLRPNGSIDGWFRAWQPNTADKKIADSMLKIVWADESFTPWMFATTEDVAAGRIDRDAGKNLLVGSDLGKINRN